MRVAIVNLTGGRLSGGYLKYLRRLVPLLAQRPEIGALNVFVPEAARARLDPDAGPLRTWSAQDARNGFKRLKQDLRETRADVLFIPTAGWLAVDDIPVVSMVRNMEPLEVPFGGNPLSESARNLARRFMARRATRRAARVIAVSGHVKQFLTTRWRIPAEKIGVVYHGVDAPEAETAPIPPSPLSNALRGPFIFTAGSIRPARGLDDLIEALPQVTAIARPPALVIAGQVDAGMSGYHERLRERAEALAIADRIVWTGPLNDAQMRWYYEACTAFVMTSRAEACPNIALEAMSHGCACVSVDRQPMPEIFGSAAEYYEVGDAAGLANGLTNLLQSPRRRADLREGARTRAAEFDWHVTAQKTAVELRAAVSS